MGIEKNEIITNNNNNKEGNNNSEEGNKIIEEIEKKEIIINNNNNEEGSNNSEEEIKMMDKVKPGISTLEEVRGSKKDEIITLLDTGATASCSSERKILLKENNSNIVIQGINGTSNYNTRGNVKGKVMDLEGRSHKVEKEGIIYIEGQDTVLSYVGFWKKNGWRLDDTGEYTLLRKGDSNIKVIQAPDGLMYVPVIFEEKDSIRRVKEKKEMDINEFHERVGHLSDIKELKKKATVLDIILNGELNCMACQIVGYQKDRIRSKGVSRTLVVNRRLFFDYCGPVKVCSINKGKINVFLAVLVEDATRLTYGFVTPSKSAVSILPILEEILIQIGVFGKIEVIRADQGSETWGKEVNKCISKMGIRMEGTGPDSPEYNSPAEGKIWRVFKKMLVLLERAGCSGENLTMVVLKHAWILAIYWINKEITKANTGNKPPMEIFKMMTGQKIREDFDGIFGQVVIIQRSDRRKGDFEPKGEIGVIVGIDLRVRGRSGCDGAAVIMKEKNGQIITTQHYKTPKVNIFYWKEKGTEKEEWRKQMETLMDGMYVNNRKEEEDIGITSQMPIIEGEREDGESYYEGGEQILNIEGKEGEEIMIGDQVQEEDMDESDVYVYVNGEEEEEDKEEEEQEDTLSALRGVVKLGPLDNRENEMRKEPIDSLQSLSGLVNTKSMTENEMIDIGLERMFKAKKMENDNKPKRFEDIAKIEDEKEKEEWMKSVRKEVNDLYEAGSIEFVRRRDMVKNIRIKNSGIILEEKIDNEGNTTKKARLVAKELKVLTKNIYTDQELFAPVVGISAVKSVLAMAVEKGKKIYHFDISQAFTSTMRREEDIVYINNVGFSNKHDGGEDGVIRLRCYLYGERPSAKEYNDKMNRFFTKLDYSRSPVDPCLYYKRSRETDKWVMVNLHVDDIIPVGEEEDCLKLKKQLGKKFLFTDLTKEQRILGMKVTHDEKEGIVELNQELYIKKLGEVFQIRKTRRVPMPFKNMESLDEQELVKVDQKEYMQMVGSILYCTSMTRSDLILYTTYLCSNMKDPNQHNKEVAIGVIEYLMGTSYKSLTYKRQVDPEMKNKLVGYGDGGGVAGLEDGKSRLAYVIMMNGGAIMAKSTSTDFVEDNMLLIEFVAAYKAYRELLALSNLHNEFNNQGKILTVYTDNKSTIYVANKPGQTKKSRLIRLTYWGLREACDARILDLIWCPTERMIADIGTKVMGGEVFTRLADMVLGRVRWSLDGSIKWVKELVV